MRRVFRASLHSGMLISADEHAAEDGILQQRLAPQRPARGAGHTRNNTSTPNATPVRTGGFQPPRSCARRGPL